MKQRIRDAVFRLLGKDPEAVVVCFFTGDTDAGLAMAEEIRRLVPDRRHFIVTLAPLDLPGVVTLSPGSAVSLYRQLRRHLRHFRIGLAPLLIDGGPEHRALRRAAVLLAPGKLLAYNARLERHHLRLRSLVTSFLFLRGLPLDRARLRPSWLTPWKRPAPADDAAPEILEGRPFVPGRRRVAMLAPYFPYPLAHGGAVRMFHLLREAAREYDVVLFSFRESAVEQAEPVLEFCSRVILVSRTPYREPRWSTLLPPEVGESRSATLQRLWDACPSDYNVEARQVEYTQMASYGGDILVAHDLNSDLYGQLLARAKTPAALWNWWRWKRYERRALQRYARVIVMSERDAAMVSEENVRVVPNGVDLERFEPQPEQPGARLLFIGSFRHFPNALAWQFFTRDVWPLVRDRFPEITATVVGGPDPLHHWQQATGTPAPPADPRLHLLGFVSDVRPLYVETNLAVIPILASAGTQLKTLEAMAMERAIVATPAGSKGLGLEHGVSAWIAEDASGLAEGIATLLADDALRRKLAQNARRLAEERYDWHRIGAAQRQVLRDILDPPISIRPATAADVPDLDRIQHTSPEAVLWEPSGYLAYTCRVAEMGGRVVGFVVSRSLAADEAEILSLLVEPERRRRGIAQRLMRQVMDLQPGTWYLEVRESNWPARKLYGKLGFEDISVRPDYYQDTGETAVVMRLKPC